MTIGNLHVLSTYLKKWSYHDNRMSLSYSYFTEKGYGRDIVDMRISAPHNMVNEVLNRMVNKAKDKFNEDQVVIKIVNEADVQRKLNMFLGKVLKEFNTNKRSRGRVRMISSRSMDFYYNDFEYEPLDENVKFYVHLNRGINKMNGDLWSAAIDDLKQALAFEENNALANKYLAEALVKSHRIEEALPYYEKFAEYENTITGLNDLAHAYIKLERYTEAANILKKMKKIDPNDMLVKIGESQIAYLQQGDYLSLLDKIYEEDDMWLRGYLRKSWQYKLPGMGKDESKMWNAATSSRYLGYDRPFDLTKRAFNDELPCYFDSEKGTIRFVKAELDNWVEFQNRYRIDGETYQSHPERITAEELKVGELPKKKKRTTKKTKAPAKK
jgi:tetratricopeptide (TPR) repeat protein